jgi:hypothetical protein
MIMLMPGETIVATTANCEIILAPHGFYARSVNSTYVSRYTSSKSVARRWADNYDNDRPDDGRES